MLLGLFQERSQCFSHVSETQLHRLVETFAVPLKLSVLQLEVCGQGTSAILNVFDRRNAGRRRPSQEGHLLSQNLGMLKFLYEMGLEFIDSAEKFRSGDGRNMADVLHDGLEFRGLLKFERGNCVRASRYEYTVTRSALEATGAETYVVTCRLDGNFPGRTVERRFSFILSEDLIQHLEIAP